MYIYWIEVVCISDFNILAQPRSLPPSSLSLGGWAATTGRWTTGAGRSRVPVNATAASSERARTPPNGVTVTQMTSTRRDGCLTKGTWRRRSTYPSDNWGSGTLGLQWMTRRGGITWGHWFVKEMVSLPILFISCDLYQS